MTEANFKAHVGGHDTRLVGAVREPPLRTDA